MSRIAILILSTFVATCYANDIEVSKDPALVQKYESDLRAQVLTVNGGVRSPGRIFLKTGQTLTLSEALLRVGGIAYVKNDIIVRRLQGGSIIEFKLALFPGKADNDFLIKPGDSIYVPK